MKIAKEYGQAPETVEQWEPFWLSRAIELMQGESLYADNERKRFEGKSKIIR